MTSNLYGQRELRYGPAAFASLIGSPSLATAARRQPAALERAVGETPTIRATTRPAPAEPHFNVLDEGDELLVLVDLPDARPWEMRVYAYADQLCVQLRMSGRHYCQPLPAEVEPASLRPEFHEGVLTVCLTKRRVQSS